MGISSAVEWWEEWQLRILVLGSLFVQYVLLVSAPFRKYDIPSWCRSVVWLSYLGSDALAIYALATLFSRQRKQEYDAVHGNGILEVVWAPVLLMHLGGQDCISAYNIQDNELWKRHVLTAVSQITVAIYVFYKSWPGGDKRLLQVVFLLFTPGILKCLEKPWALKKATFKSLVSLPNPTSRSRKARGRDEAISLEEYVQKAQEECQHINQATQGEPNGVDLEDNPVRQGQAGNRGLEALASTSRDGRLFADLALPYPDRLAVLKSFLLYDDDRKAYDSLQQGLFNIFDCLYTKRNLAPMPRYKPTEEGELERSESPPKNSLHACVRVVVMYLPFAAIGLFHNSRREAYNVHDVKVTYALLCCTAALEYFSLVIVRTILEDKPRSRKELISSNKGPKKKMCSSSFRITMLVHGYVKGWWMEHITDVASYWRFNCHKGQWTIQRKGCEQDLEWSLNKPFDESVLLWHIATYLCFHQKGGTAVSHAKAKGCREISNYMIYLLFVEPEMLLSGTRRDLFMEANEELKEILMDDNLLLKKILKGDKPSLMEILKGKGPLFEETEKEFMQRIIAKLQPTERGDVDPGYTELPMEVEQCPSPKEGFIQDAWKISKVLLALGDETMWEVTEGVWVEMLCFSASRCGGYLHAKSMGTGVELLTYVWFLLSRMGMETLPERAQRTERAGRNDVAASSTYKVTAATGEAVA